MRVRFVYPRFARHSDCHPELRRYVPCNEYFGPPSLGIASLAAVTPPGWDVDFRDDRFEDVGLDDEVDLVAISCFTPSARRAMELSDAFRARGRRTVLGGIFPSAMPEVVRPHADAVVIGEGEGVWSDLLRDAAASKLLPRYEAKAPLDLTKLPLPRIDLYIERENGPFAPDDYPVQLSRGCPLTCSACAVPLSLGRRMRLLPLSHVLGQLDQLAAAGKRASLTEDTSFFVTSGVRRGFEELLEALAARSVPPPLTYVGISMPLLLATPGRVLDRLRAAGIKMFYLVGGFDPITRRAFARDERRPRALAMAAVQKAFDHGLEPYTSFLVGNEEDDEGTFDRMLEFAEAAKIRKAEFAIMTPYPGTPSWSSLKEEGRILTTDWSLYNDANVVFRPKLMTPDRLLEGYLYLWREFYRPRQALRDLPAEDRTIQF